MTTLNLGVMSVPDLFGWVGSCWRSRRSKTIAMPTPRHHSTLQSGSELFQSVGDVLFLQTVFTHEFGELFGAPLQPHDMGKDRDGGPHPGLERLLGLVLRLR